MTEWKCSVCGYIEKEEAPPDKCPVCNADKEKFNKNEVSESANKSEKNKKKKTEPGSKMFPLFELMSKHHAHPVSVHIPNGVLPMSVIFIMLATLFNLDILYKVAFYNFLFVMVTMPFILFSGYVEWKTKYKGNKTNVFNTKIICGLVVTALSIVIVLFNIFYPVNVTSSITMKSVYVVISILCVIPAGLAGFLGGKLVFKEFGKKKK